MNLNDLKLSAKSIKIEHPDNPDLSFTANVRHSSSRDYAVKRAELLKDQEMVLAVAISIAAVESFDGIDNLENTPEAIEEFLKNPDYFWIAAQISEPYLLQKKSSTKD